MRASVPFPYARSGQKVQLTLPAELFKELEHERVLDGQDRSRSAFLRRVLRRAVLQMQEDRWIAAYERDYFTEPDPRADPEEFTEWPGYPFDASDERVARIRDF